MSPFDFIKAIIETKPKWETFTFDQQKQFNSFMINRFLSTNKKYLEIVNYVQSLNIKENKKIILQDETLKTFSIENFGSIQEINLFNETGIKTYQTQIITLKSTLVSLNNSLTQP